MYEYKESKSKILNSRTEIGKQVRYRRQIYEKGLNNGR